MNKLITLLAKWKYVFLQIGVGLLILWIAFLCVKDYQFIAHIIGIISGFDYCIIILCYCYPDAKTTSEKIGIMIASFSTLAIIEIFSIINLIIPSLL